MKAMILAAGKGTRLSTLTETIPKCLVEVAGRPIISYVMSRVQEADIKEAVVNLHHLPDQVRTYLDSIQSPDFSISYSLEEELLDTGGGLLKALPYFEDSDDVLIHNADIYTDLQLQDMIRFHKAENAMVTLYVNETKDPRVLLFDEEGHLQGWRNDETDKERILDNSQKLVRRGFCGISIVSQSFFPYLQKHGEQFSLITAFLEAASLGHKVMAYQNEIAFWIDMGTPEKLEALRKYLS